MAHDKVYEKFVLSVMGAFSTITVVGIIMAALCGFVVFTKRKQCPSVLVIGSNIMLAHIVSVGATITSRGFLMYFPKKLEGSTCVFATFVGDGASYAICVLFLYLILDRAYKWYPGHGAIAAAAARRRRRGGFGFGYDDCGPDGEVAEDKERFSRAVKNYTLLSTLSWMLGIIASIPVSFSVVSEANFGDDVPRSCRVPLSHSSLDLVMKLCYCTMFPFFLVGAVVVESVQTGNSRMVRPLLSRMGGFYGTMFVLTVPYLVLRVFRAHTTPDVIRVSTVEAIDYVQVALDNLSLLRLVVVPMMLLVLSARSVMEDVDEAATLVVTVICRFFGCAGWPKRVRRNAGRENACAGRVRLALTGLAKRAAAFIVGTGRGGACGRENDTSGGQDISSPNYPLESLPHNFLDGSLEDVFAAGMPVSRIAEGQAPPSSAFVFADGGVPVADAERSSVQMRVENGCDNTQEGVCVVPSGEDLDGVVDDAGVLV